MKEKEFRKYKSLVAGTEVNWVQCDRCEEWFHLLCIGLGEDEISESEDYVCYKCRRSKFVKTPEAPSGVPSGAPPQGQFSDPMAPLMMAIQDDLMSGAQSSSGLSSDENMPPVQASGYTILTSGGGKRKHVNAIQNGDDSADSDDDALVISGTEAPRVETVVVSGSGKDHVMRTGPLRTSSSALGYSSAVDGVEIGEDAAAQVTGNCKTISTESRGPLPNKNADNISEVSNTMRSSGNAVHNPAAQTIAIDES